MENQQRTEVCKPNGQLSIILGYRRLSVKFSCLLSISLFSKPKDVMEDIEAIQNPEETIDPKI